MNQLARIIGSALTGGANPEQQKQAEAALVRLREQDPFGFFNECANILYNENNEDILRQSAATVLSRSAITKV